MVSARCSPEKSLAVNKLLDTLSHHVRRDVIYYFESTTTDTTASLDKLITHVETDVPLTSQEELRVSLPHTHLPLLEARNWLEFDKRNEDIQYHGHENAGEYLSELTSIFTE